jgi:DNA modification methylase
MAAARAIPGRALPLEDSPRRNPVEFALERKAPEPAYFTGAGASYCGDAGDLLRHIRSESVQLIFTSPPYALIRKKPYGNAESEVYVKWFMEFSEELRRVLTPDGSLVIDIGGAWRNGHPIKSTYQFELLLALTREDRFFLAQDFYWWNPARLPSPAEWVNVRRIRVKDSVDTVWWLSKTQWPKANNRTVLQEYSAHQKRLFENGVKSTVRPSGHEISQNFLNENGGAIPSNMLRIANTDSNSRYLQRCRKEGVSPHPARFPRQLPEFFVKFLTDRGDLVLDPFSGSNMTGWVAENERRKWIAFEMSPDYVENSKLRWS